MVELFEDGKRGEVEEKNLLIEELYGQIGRLKVELDSSQKKLDLPAASGNCPLDGVLQTGGGRV